MQSELNYMSAYASERLSLWLFWQSYKVTSSSPLLEWNWTRNAYTAMICLCRVSTYISISLSVRNTFFINGWVLYDWIFGSLYLRRLEPRKWATAGLGSKLHVPTPFSATSKRSLTLCKDMDSRLSFLKMLYWETARSTTIEWGEADSTRLTRNKMKLQL